MSKLNFMEKLLYGVEVEWKTLGEVCKIETGKLNANQEKFDGEYLFFTCDELPKKIDVYTHDTEAILISGNGSRLGHVTHYIGKFNAYQRTYILNNFSNVIVVRYLYFILLNGFREHANQNKKPGSVPYIVLENVSGFTIPIPPRTVQEEIVRILDTFTELTAELTAELTTRKKQYEYYREQLLSFEPQMNTEKYGFKVVWKTLGELFEFKNGINKEKEAFGKGNAIINYTDVFKKNKLYEKSILGKVETNKSDIQRFNCKKGDVFFTRTSETKNEIGYASVLLSDISICVFSGFLIRARPITNLLLPEYCAYCFTSNEIRTKIICSSNITTRVTITGTILSKIRIPIPPLAEQERIVSILDKFDILTTSLSEGLPKEIELRKKQYEYYRDMLLSFPKKEVTE